MSDQDIKILAIGILWFFIGCVFGFLIGKTINMKEENKQMVTCVLLGGFANNLFIIMATISYALKHKINYCIPTHIKNPHYPEQKVFYSKNINYCDKPNGIACVYNEPFFHYKEIPKRYCDNLVLSGYFQSYRFWGEYLSQIKKLLGFNCKTKHAYTVAIHQRRGDYLNYPTIHPVTTIQYLHEAIARVIKITGDFHWEFKFYSDDIEWCKEAVFGSLKDLRLQFEFSEGKTEEEDFRDMIGCRHFIISNSSFSLLAAILSESPDKVCIGPKIWFGESLPHNTADLIPDNFILI